MTITVDHLFHRLTEGKAAKEARIDIYEKIRDIPYALIPSLISAENYLDILTLGKGSCTPKHLLLAALYQKLGFTVLLAIYPFRWANVEIELPPRLKKQADSLPEDHHLACRVEIGGKLVLVDATVDLPLEGLGLPVNRYWDGINDTLLPVNPSGDEQIYHPSEVRHVNSVFIDEAHLKFFKEFNDWLENVRKSLNVTP